MKSDDAAGKIAHITWARTPGEDGPTTDSFFGIVRIGEVEFKRFAVSKNDYASDVCAPCESTRKSLDNEIARILRQEYGE